VIVNWLMMLMQTAVTGFVGMLPDFSVPSAVANLDSQVNSLTSTLSGLGAWVAWPVALVLMLIPLALWGAGVGFKVALFIWAKVPVIGGK